LKIKGMPVPQGTPVARAKALTQKTNAESARWRSVANYHSALIELTIHPVEVFNGAPDEARNTERLQKGQSRETPTFETDRVWPKGAKQALPHHNWALNRPASRPLGLSA
jgi:hypothetical protein